MNLSCKENVRVVYQTNKLATKRIHHKKILNRLVKYFIRQHRYILAYKLKQ